MNLFRADLDDKPVIKVSVPIRKYMMCLNESNLNPIDALAGKMMEAFEQVPLNRYVSDITSRLKQALADYVGYGITPAQILIGNGVDEMLYFIFTAVRHNASTYALSLAPSYFDYQTYSGSVGLGMEFLDFDSKFDFSTEEYLKKLNHADCSLGIICNPNNPTGHLISDEKILHIIENTKKPLLLDETYFEFSGKTMIDLIYKYPHIIISRSFSKSFSAAGLRFGYIISSKENIDYLNKVIPVFNCGLLTQTIALALLQDKDFFFQNNEYILSQRDAMYTKMNAYSEVTVYPSHTNFLTFSVGERTVRFFDFLQERDISVRPVWGHPLLHHHLRVTVCDSESNTAFLKALNEFVSKI